MAEERFRSIQQKRPFPFEEGITVDALRRPAVDCEDDDEDTSSEEKERTEMLTEADKMSDEDDNGESSFGAGDCQRTASLRPAFSFDASPYEIGFNAETKEPLFRFLSEYFDALTDCEKWTTRQLDDAKQRFRDISPDSYTLKLDTAFFTAVCEARDQVDQAVNLWNEEWKEQKFGSTLGSRSIKRAVPGYVLLLFLRPHLIATAKRKELHNLYSRLGLLSFFKSALTKMDPAKSFELLHSSPARALRNIAHYKMLIFIVRVYLAMRFCLCISFEEVRRQIGGGDSLERKCMKCLENLQEAIVNSAKREEPEQESHTKPPASKRALSTDDTQPSEKPKVSIPPTGVTESDRKRKRLEVEVDIDGLISKCDRLLNNFSQMQDDIKAVKQFMVKQKEKKEEDELEQNLFKRMKRLLVEEIDLNSDESEED